MYSCSSDTCCPECVPWSEFGNLLSMGRAVGQRVVLLETVCVSAGHWVGWAKTVICFADTDPGDGQTWWVFGKGRQFFFPEVLFWAEFLVFWKSLRVVICHFCSVNPMAVQRSPAPFQLLRSGDVVITETWLDRGLCPLLLAVSSIYQILAKFSCYSSCTNRIFSQSLLLEEDEIVYCMSEIFWSKLLSTKIQVIFNTGTGILCYRSLFF